MNSIIGNIPFVSSMQTEDSDKAIMDIYFTYNKNTYDNNEFDLGLVGSEISYSILNDWGRLPIAVPYKEVKILKISQADLEHIENPYDDFGISPFVNYKITNIKGSIATSFLK